MQTDLNLPAGKQAEDGGAMETNEEILRSHSQTFFFATALLPGTLGKGWALPRPILNLEPGE